jgi:carbamoyl-phosphate synthase large subunit
MGLDTSFGRAFAKSQIGAGTRLPMGGAVFISVKDSDKDLIVAPARDLLAMGFSLVATGGTARVLAQAGLPVATINKVLEGRPHVVDALKNGEIHLVFNTTEGSQALADSSSIRRAALTLKVPYYTTVAGAKAATEAIEALKGQSLEVAPLQSYSLMSG